MKIKKLLTTLVLVLVVGIGIQADGAPSKIVGGNIDNTPPGPTPPCTTFGFSIDATNTLPVGQNNARMVRVDPTGNTDVGYVVTSQATGYTVYVFNMRTMGVVGSTVNTITGYVDAGRLQGDIASDGKLYIFNPVSIANPSCPANTCVMMSRWNGTTMEASNVDSTGVPIANIDDARESSTMFLVVVGDLGGLRQFRTYTKSLAFVATGTLTGVSAFGHIGRTIGGVIYGGLGSALNPNFWVFNTDDPTAVNSGQALFTAGKLLSAIFPIMGSTNLFGFDSNVATAQRAWIQSGTITVQGPTSFSGGLADGAASFQGAFYDTLNVKGISLRTDGVQSGSAQRTIVGPTGFITEENFVCGVQCNNSGSTSTGTQIVDYSQRFARMYVGSNESPARLTRIKICATGGPSL